VVVGVDAELAGLSVNDVIQCEDRIVSQWSQLSVGVKSQLRDRVDEILRPLGYETSLLVMRRANSIAVYFICLSLFAATSLRDQWGCGQLRDIVESLFTFLSGAAARVIVKRLTWPLNDYQRCLVLFNSLHGK